MKTVLSFLLAACILFPWCSVPLSAQQNQARPEKKIPLTGEHDDQAEETTATLGQEEDWDWLAWSSDDWNGGNLDFNVQKKEACLGVYTEASALNNNLSGARITNFTAESAAKEALLLENDVITAVNGQRIRNHSDLWAAIARYKAGDKIKVEFQRQGQAQTIEATLKPCQDDASQVTVENTDEEGDQQSRRFNTWNWNNDDQRQMRQNRLITIHKGGEGDAAKVNVPSAASLPAELKLPLESFKAVPNPADGQVTVRFRGAPVATVVSLLDLNGRQLFREELNMFSGEYNQPFDLTEYSKSAITILVQQGDKSVTEQIIIK